jgi:DNA-binding beta-propeller fold protein YncE
MAAAPDGRGYWLVAADGGVFAFGSARFHGSTGAIRLYRPVVGMAAAPDGRGYWLVAADGGVFAFGSARFLGSLGGAQPAAWVAAMAATPSGHGYWLLGSDATIAAFGDALDARGSGVTRPFGSVAGLAATTSGGGYWIVDRVGGLFRVGDAGDFGAPGDWSLLGPFATPQTAGTLAVASDPSVLPSAVLIADRSNNRLVVVDPLGRVTWTFPQPGDLPAGTAFLVPDDAFFSPDGREIVATEEDDAVVSVIDVATRRIVYRYGTPGVPGSGPNQVSNPDDAMLLPDGYLFVADIKNCRLLLIAPEGHEPSRVIGTTTTACLHAPPSRWGSPNGAFPMRNGHYIVTEINGSWVDELALDGTVVRSLHPPGVGYPSDTNEVSPSVFVTVGYTSPGVLETFDVTGRLLWRYAPRPGDPPLQKPSLALPLPNGAFLLNDDFNQRVVVVDPTTNAVRWQYGQTGQPGNAPGALHQPDGVDLLPPYSLLGSHAATMGLP